MDPLVFSVRVFDYLFMIFDKLAQGAWNKIERKPKAPDADETSGAQRENAVFVLTLEFLRIGPQFDARRVALSTS